MQEVDQRMSEKLLFILSLKSLTRSYSQRLTYVVIFCDFFLLPAIHLNFAHHGNHLTANKLLQKGREIPIIQNPINTIVLVMY